MMNISLVIVPPVNPHAPSASIPYLAGYLAAVGHSVSVIDLNTIALQENLPPEVIRALQSPPSSEKKLATLTAAEGAVEKLQEKLWNEGSFVGPTTCWEDIEEQASIFSSSLIRGIVTHIQMEPHGCPYIVALSCINELHVSVALRLAQTLKESHSDLNVVLGGPAMVKIESWPTPAWLFSYLDYLVISGGAHTFDQLLHSISGRKTQPPGVISKTNTILNITTTPNYAGKAVMESPLFNAKTITNTLAPTPILPIFSAQGCSYGKCVFCGSQRRFSPYNPVPIEWIVGEMNRLNRTNNTSYFDIIDNNFDYQRLLQFSRLLLSKRYSYKWKATSRFYPMMTTSLLKQVYDAGCRLLSLGLESYDDRCLREMNKGYTTDTVRSVLEAAQKVGIPVHLYAIIGHPGETTSSRQATLTFLQEKRNSFVSVYFQYYDDHLASGIFVNEIKRPSTIEYINEDYVSQIEESFGDSYTFYRERKGLLVRPQNYPKNEELFFFCLALKEL